jgi:nicotinate-nucleotide pyrophosphorylase (carboxylating)
MTMNWNSPAIKTLIALAFAEDASRTDVTTSLLIEPSWQTHAEIRAKQTGVVAGLPLAELFFKRVDRKLVVKTFLRDGARVSTGTCLLSIRGNARSILIGERPALNALQHLSGIATLTHECVQKLGRSRTRLLDTRKTLPGWRVLEKYAVRCGGGHNHRMSLGDALLVKENHLKLCRMAGAVWVNKVEGLRRAKPSFPVQIEVQTERDLREAIAARPQRVLLDNMPVAKLRRVIRQLRRALPDVEIEISGGVRPEQLHTLARLGVERISMGRLTHSAPAFDCSLDFLNVDAR